MAKNTCECMHMHVWMGWKLLVVGALVLANAKWPMLSWPYFIGGIAVIAGLAKLFMPCKCK